jgi:hypothetical protein
MSGLSIVAQGKQSARVRRADDNQNWGLKVPGRPPTPSEGAAQVKIMNSNNASDLTNSLSPIGALVIHHCSTLFDMTMALAFSSALTYVLMNYYL